MVPCLATEWTNSEDGKTWTFEYFMRQVLINNCTLFFPIIITLIAGYIITREYTNDTIKNKTICTQRSICRNANTKAASEPAANQIQIKAVGVISSNRMNKIHAITQKILIFMLSPLHIILSDQRPAAFPLLETVQTPFRRSLLCRSLRRSAS